MPKMQIKHILTKTPRAKRSNLLIYKDKTNLSTGHIPLFHAKPPKFQWVCKNGLQLLVSSCKNQPAVS
jgi:hypothetical protein